MRKTNNETTNTVTPVAPVIDKAPKTDKKSTKNKDKDKKTNNNKDKKSTKKTSNNDNKKFEVDIDNRTVNIVLVQANVSSEVINDKIVLTHSAKVNTRKITLPKTIKDDQLTNFSLLVQGKVFDYLTEQSNSKTASLKQKISKTDSGVATPAQNNQLEAYKAQRTSITKLRTKYNVGKANLVTDMLAQLVACNIVGHKLPIETSNLQNCIKANYTALHEFVLTGVKDGKAEMTEEQKASVTALQKSIVDTMGVFCKATTWADSFKLKSSGTDAVHFYELCYLKTIDTEPIFLWNNDKKGERIKELDKELCQWLFKKMKVDVNE